MEIGLLIKRRLEELHMEQRDLAAAAQVTESYISQLLTRKKLPPSPARTDIYEKIGSFLKLPAGELAKLAEHERIAELKKNLAPPAPLFREVRELILQKASPSKQKQIRAIFEKEPFGELERLITQKLLDIVKRVARDELDSETWLRSVARISGRTYESMRVGILEFLDADVFDLSPENCASFLDPLIESWDIDLSTFGLEVVLNRRLNPGSARKIEFVERDVPQPAEEAGLNEFLRHQGAAAISPAMKSHSCAVCESRARPPRLFTITVNCKIFAIRSIFAPPPAWNPWQEVLDRVAVAWLHGLLHTRLDAKNVEKQFQLDTRKDAIRRWEGKRGRHGKKRP